jgi:ubiquinone/menaquinone biosynthesis C-methylase UbiE
MAPSNYSKIKKDFDREAREGKMFSKNQTECDRLSIKALDKIAKKWWKILEIGCGMGNVIENLKESYLEKHCIDLSGGMLEKCGIVNKKVGNMDELPYLDEEFDLVYMIMTLQQSQDRHKTLSEMERVTKPYGWMVVIDGDKDSPVGQEREKRLKEGTWETCGKAEWLSVKDFPKWEAEHLAPHILLLKKQKWNYPL